MQSIWKDKDLNTLNQGSEDIVRLQNIAIEIAKDGIALLSPKGFFYYLNDAHVKLFGYESAEQLIGKSWKVLYNENEVARIENEIFPILINEGRWAGETTGMSQYGDAVYQEITLSYLPDGEMVCICRDCRSRKKELEELQKLAMVVENTNSMVVITDKHGTIEWVNPAFTEVTGYSFDEVIGKRPGKLLQGEETDPSTKQYLFEKISSGSSFECEVLNFTKKGDPYWVKIHGQPVFNEQGELYKYFSIQEDITYRKKIERDLLIAKEAAEASEKAKRKFLANMSHEIRTPMNAIIGLSEQLLKSKLSKEQQFFSETINAAANNLLTIINDILDISKIEEGKLRLEYIPINLREVVERAIHVLKYKAEEKGLNLSLEFDAKIHPYVIGDPFRLNQVLLNIIGNGIKFTHSGSVHVQCMIKQCTENLQVVDINISDTGIGVDENLLENIFVEFEQGDQSYGRKYGGTGLGLSISKNLVELMKGTIQFKSRKFAGTTVALTIPFEKQSGSGLKELPVVQTDVSLLKDKIVLLVEDNKFNSLVASLILKAAKINTLYAYNGEQAIELLKQHPVDIILMDIQMPVMDGVKATQIIRNELKIKAPIIALTAHALSEEKDHYLGAGMNDFLAKPYTESQLLGSLLKWAQNNNTNKTNLFNTVAIKEFTGLNDDTVLILSKTFLEELTESNQELKNLLNNKDWNGIRSCIHKMKPGFIMFGFHQVTDLMKEILDLKMTNQLADKITDLVQQYLEFSRELEADMHRNLPK